MKRRDFILGAAGLLLFPADAFAKTVTHTERTFGRRMPKIPEDEIIEKEILYETPIMPKIERSNVILMENDMDERETTNRIIVHHTGNATDKDMSAKEAHLLHKYDFGWAGIGYHYVIRKDGTIEEARPEPFVGAHALSNNYDSIGIALSGNFNLTAPTELQMESLLTLSLYLADKYDLNLKEKGVFQGHKDVNDTSCPGTNLYCRLDYIRDNAI